jgi:hypothetical protein
MKCHESRCEVRCAARRSRRCSRCRAGRSSLRTTDFPPHEGTLFGGHQPTGIWVWLLASFLVTARAIAIHAGVFIVLGGIQIVATALIVYYTTRYEDMYCPIHLPRRSGAEKATETIASGNELAPD